MLVKYGLPVPITDKAVVETVDRDDTVNVDSDDTVNEDSDDTENDDSDVVDDVDVINVELIVADQRSGDTAAASRMPVTFIIAGLPSLGMINPVNGSADNT